MKSTELSDHGIEKAVLSAMIRDGEAVARVAVILEAADFTNPQHRAIYESIISLFNDSKVVDIITLSDELSRVGKLKMVGDSDAIVQLTMETSTSANVEAHAMIVKELSLRRQMRELGAHIQASSEDVSKDVFDVINDSDDKILRIGGALRGGDSIEIADIVDEVSQDVDDASAGKAIDEITPTGFYDIDRLLVGHRSGHLTLYAGRPSMGKTALSLAEARLISEKHSIGYFSFEQPRKELVLRLATMESGIEYHRLEQGKFRVAPIEGVDEAKDFVRAMSKIRELKLVIDDTPALTLTQLRARTLRMKSRYKIKGIYIDYLQLMRIPSANKGSSRNDDVSAVSSGLKQLARELGIFVVALSQLNRGVEYRTNKQPMLADLRESGSLEQDADDVIFIWRPEVYGITTYEWRQHDKMLATTDLPEGFAEAIIAKQRNGAVGTVDLLFQKERMRFVNAAKSSVSTTYYSGRRASSGGGSSLPIGDRQEIVDEHEIVL